MSLSFSNAFGVLVGGISQCCGYFRKAGYKSGRVLGYVQKETYFADVLTDFAKCWLDSIFWENKAKDFNLGKAELAFPTVAGETKLLETL